MARDGGGASPARPPLQALIFDVDGVLVRSMDRHHEAYRRAFADHRIEVKRDEVYLNEGRRSREVIEAIGKARSLRLTPDDVAALVKKKQEAFFSFGPLPLYPGVPELLARAKSEGLKLAAVTGTNRANVDNHLGSLVRRFDVIVTADDVVNGKPDPEPFSTALAKLAVEPARALVVENAILGIRSAKAAGLRVIALTTTMPREALAQADVIVSGIPDVWPAVERLRA